VLCLELVLVGADPRKNQRIDSLLLIQRLLIFNRGKQVIFFENAFHLVANVLFPAPALYAVQHRWLLIAELCARGAGEHDRAVKSVFVLSPVEHLLVLELLSHLELPQLLPADLALGHILLILKKPSEWRTIILKAYCLTSVHGGRYEPISLI